MKKEDSRAETQRRGGGWTQGGAAEKMSPVFAKQLKTYLAITKLQVGVVVNFWMSTLKEGFLRFVNNYNDPIST